MKKIFLFTLVSFMCVLVSTAQRFQVTTGTSQANEKWAVMADTLPSGAAGYIAIGNTTNVDNFRQIWISSYTTNGVMVTSALASTGRQIIARDICLAPFDATTGKRSYYVTGWTQQPSATGAAAMNQMFVGRIRLDGSFIWYQENPISSNGNNIEGVAVATAPNGDVVAVGNINIPATATIAGGSRITLSRFSSVGAILWSKVYNQTGNWMAREIARGVPAPNCVVSPTALPGEFIVTGEATIQNVAGGGRATAFVASYNGAGTECWKNLYPANLTALSITGDAGYDVVFNPATQNYAVAGVAQTGAIRAAITSTPYLFEVSPAGVITIGAVYVGPNNNTLGLYPRSIAVGAGFANPGTTGTQLVIAGPDFGTNKTFMARLSAVGAAGSFNNYNGLASANSLPQPFTLNDAQPESILYSKLTSKPGYFVSTNAYPAGAFGGGDAHFIMTDLNGQTPDDCKALAISNIVLSTKASTTTQSSVLDLTLWGSKSLFNQSLAVQQRFCNDICNVTSSFTFTQTGGAVSFTGTGTGNGTVAYNWNFGDGSTSSLQNPTHTYASGTYTACLTVINTNSAGDTCSETICKQITVQTQVCDVKASFTYKVSCKYKVSFVNTSTGTAPLTYKWFFDDGSTSTIKNPVKTFDKCGPHRTYLIVCNPICCDTFFSTIDIPCCSVKSDFCLQDSGLYVKLLYSTTMNPSPTVYKVYVDGVLTTWTANSNKLLTAGVHTICLKASRALCPGDTCCATCCKTILVRTPCSLQADFWYLAQSTGNVVFTNKTLPIGSSSVWNFGDGSPLSTTYNTSHLYTTTGTYTVVLTSTTVNGMDTCRSSIAKIIVIQTPCKVTANFKTKYCLSTPLTVEFINYSVGATYSMWDFGDGTTSTLPNDIHTYVGTGTYYVCLTTYSNDRCMAKSCFKVLVNNPFCDTSCSTLPVNPNGIVVSKVNENTNVARVQPDTKQVIVTDKLSLFPNPASQKVQVVFETGMEVKGDVSIINSLGSLVYRKSVPFIGGKNHLSVPIDAFTNGNYFVRITSGNNIHTALFTVKN